MFKKKHGEHGGRFFLRGRKITHKGYQKFTKFSSKIINKEKLLKVFPFILAVIISVFGVFYATTKRLLPDDIPPLVELFGEEHILIPLNGEYVEPGYSCTDNEDYICKMEITGSVDTTTIGIYTLEYIGTDPFGNKSEKHIRTIEVTDKPIIYGVRDGEFYNSTVTITVSKGSIKINGTSYDNGVEINDEGTYNLEVEDEVGNKSNLTFYIDLTSPVIEVNDLMNKVIQIGTSSVPYDQFFTVTDNLDTSIAPHSSMVTGNLNIDKVGIYNLRLDIFDQAGNHAYRTITVEVVDDSTDESCFITSGSTITDYNSHLGHCTDIVKVPAKVSGTTITSIGNSAFKNKGITYFRNNNYVSSIGNNALENNNLNTLVLGDSLETIGEYAFYNTTISSVVIPDNVHTIMKSAFENSRVENLSFGINLNTIGERAFYNHNMNQVTFNIALNTIGNEAFISTHKDIDTVYFEGEDDKDRFNSIWNTIGLSNAIMP